MSYLNPNHTEVFSITKGIVGKDKSYLNLAKRQFKKLYNRKPTLDDAVILRSLIEQQWEKYYITSNLTHYEYKLGKNIWQYGVEHKVDVAKALSLYFRGIKYPIIYAYALNKVDEFKKYMFDNKTILKHVYTRSKYVDFGHFAYNNSSNDL